MFAGSNIVYRQKTTKIFLAKIKNRQTFNQHPQDKSFCSSSIIFKFSCFQFSHGKWFYRLCWPSKISLTQSKIPQNTLKYQLMNNNKIKQQPISQNSPPPFSCATKQIKQELKGKHSLRNFLYWYCRLRLPAITKWNKAIIFVA